MPIHVRAHYSARTILDTVEARAREFDLSVVRHLISITV
jgi:hypothetical protein